jgi:ribosomal protein S14
MKPRYLELLHIWDALAPSSAAEVSGLPSSYLAKLLSPSPKPARRFGAISLGPVLGTLGIKLIVTTDENAEKKFGSKLEKRQEKCAHYGGVIRQTFSRKHMREIGKKGAQVRWEAVRDRNAAARKAALARWRKYHDATSSNLAEFPSAANSGMAKRKIR